MASSIAPSLLRLAVLRPEERPWGALAHAMAWWPVWGFFVNALLYLYFKNRSRQLVFHVQQAVQMQIFVLLPLLAWIVLSIFINVASALNSELAVVLERLNDFALTACLGAAAVICLYGAVTVYRGIPFVYPIFGKRVLEASARKFEEL